MKSGERHTINSTNLNLTPFLDQGTATAHQVREEIVNEPSLHMKVQWRFNTIKLWRCIWLQKLDSQGFPLCVSIEYDIHGEGKKIPGCLAFSAASFWCNTCNSSRTILRSMPLIHYKLLLKLYSDQQKRERERKKLRRIELQPCRKILKTTIIHIYQW